MKTIMTFMLLFLTSISIYAQKVSGVVLDEKKVPIIGAAVLVKGTTQGAATDIDGKFELNVPDLKNDALVVSYIGYKKKHQKLDGKSMLTIMMEPEVHEIQEVVISVGYGSMKKSDITGSIVSIQTSEEESLRATSFDRMLQGKAAGLVVNTGSAAPGGASNVRIRGNSSLRGNNSPLYVVDGIIITTEETQNPMGQGAGGGNSMMSEQNPLSSISPQDIESIEVLKDASATAIYGSQGANGVILITTKKGKTGKPTVNVGMTLTASHMKKQVPMLETADYLGFYNYFLGSTGTPLTMNDVTPVNWQERSTRTALSQNYRTSISGKANKTSYYLSLGYLSNQGIIKESAFSQYDMRLNITQEISNVFQITSNTSFSSLNTTMTSGTDKLSNTRSSLIRHMVLFKPVMTSKTDTESYDEELTGPDAWFRDYDDDSNDNQFRTNITLDIKPKDWLSFQVKGGLNYRTKERSMWYGKETFVGQQTNGKAGISNIKNLAFNAEALMLVNKTFNKKHAVSGTFGVVYNNSDLTSSSITGEDFSIHSLRAKGISSASILYPYIYKEVGDQLFSVLARGLYSYDNKYMLTATFRADGSSKFSKSNRFSYFPSFAFAWRVNQEGFMQDATSVSNMKLRLGWGQVGSQAIAPYQTLSNYYNNNYSKPDGSVDTGVVPSRIANPDLKWETSEQYNAGVDVGFFDQRLTFVFDAYLKKTKDLLQEIAIPTGSGFNSMYINRGTIDNKGIELTVDATPYQNKKWKWNIGGNISVYRSKIKSLGMPTSTIGTLENVQAYLGGNLGNNNTTKFPVNIFVEGKPVGMFFGYQTSGIMQEANYNAQDPSKRLSFNGAEIKPGEVLFVDQNGDGVINESDRTVIGNPNPDFVYALNTSLSYKNLTLDMAFNGVYGNEIVNANLIDECDVKNASKNVRKDAYFQAWTPENKSNTYPKLGTQPNNVLSDRLVQDGSYFRLSALTLSYNMNLKKVKFIRSLVFSGTVNNVFCITKYNGYDPDVNSFSNDIDRMGIDLASYPASRSYVLGVSATF